MSAREDSCTAVRLRDTLGQSIYTLNLPANIVSDKELVVNGDSEVCVVPPGNPGEEYSLVIDGAPPVVNVRVGVCSLNGVVFTPDSSIPPTLTPGKILTPGSFITLGSARSLQYVSSEGTSVPRRKLPPTPGKSVQPSPPAKPRRQRQPPLLHQLSPLEDTSPEDPGLRPCLQRIAAEVSARLKGYEDRKPPPPYEQVGNSIGYQLLHQNRHKDITPQLIDALYPPLKENITKDTSLESSYSSYLMSFKESLSVCAIPECKLPADHPTIDFLVDLLLHVCCMPHMTGLAEKQGHVWMQTLAVFSASPQNRTYLVARRYPSKILSCMHLGMMSDQIRFQQHGWSLLSHCLPVPRAAGSKPVLSEASLTLALCLAESQLDHHSRDFGLMLSTVKFLAEVAILAKTASTKHSSISRTSIYTPHQALQILALFQDKGILRHVMKIPSELRSGAEFEHCYSNLVKALVPTRGQLVPRGSRRKSRTPSTTSNYSITSAFTGRSQQKDSMRNSGEPFTNCTDLQLDSPEVESTDDLLKSYSTPLLASCSDLTTPTSEPVTMTLRSASCSDLLEDTNMDVDFETNGAVAIAHISDGCPSQPVQTEEDTAISNKRSNQDNVVTMDTSTPLSDSTHSNADNKNDNHVKLVSSDLHLSNSTHFKQIDSSHNVHDDSTHNGQGDSSHKGQDNSSYNGQDDSSHNGQDDSSHNGQDDSSHNGQDDSSHNGQDDSSHKGQDDSSHKGQDDSSHKGQDGSTQNDSTHKEQDDSAYLTPTDCSSGQPDSSPLEQLDSSHSTLSPPLSPYSVKMSEDVQELLELLRAPLEPTTGTIVRVPSLSRHNRYYRHSVKHKYRTTGHQGNQEKESLHEVHQENQESERKTKMEDNVKEKLQGTALHPASADQSIQLNEETDSQKLVEETTEKEAEPESSGEAQAQSGQAWSGIHEQPEEVDHGEICNSPLTPSRMEWRSAQIGRNIHGDDPSSMFEVSGHHLSLRHSVVEDVTASHHDLHNTLLTRHQMLQSVLSLWSKGKGLQAATNLLQACFSEEENDVTLFMDTLPCLLAHKSPWTLAVCVVLLPPMHQLLSVHCLQRHVKVLCEVVQMIVDRFTNLIVAWQGSKWVKRRISAAVDREQQIICYKELHALRSAIHHRLDNSNSLPTEITDYLRQLHAALRPFKQSY